MGLSALYSQMWDITVLCALHLRVAPLLSHLTAVKYMTSPKSASDCSKKVLNWRWFRPLDFRKLTDFTAMSMTCFIPRVWASRASWCLIQWYLISFSPLLLASFSESSDTAPVFLLTYFKVLHDCWDENQQLRCIRGFIQCGGKGSLSQALHTLSQLLFEIAG